MEQRGTASTQDLTVRKLVEEHYQELRRIARAKRRRSHASMTLMTTDLLHESWLKLRNQSDWRDENHFMNTAALAMRQVLVDHARSKLTAKRHAPNGQWRDDLDELLQSFGETPEEIVVLSDLLSKLELENRRLAQVTTLRYFAGFTEEETANILNVSSRTVRRDWQLARVWLAAQMGVEPGDDS